MGALRGIAYTNQVEFGDQAILSGVIQCDPALPMTFLSLLHDAVTVKLGWSSDVYENGHVYLLQAPTVSFYCQVRIWYKTEDDPEYPCCYAFQFHSNYEDGPTGHIHHISAKGYWPYEAFDYQVWANKCQLFIGRLGVRQAIADHVGHFPFRPYSVCGGVAHPLDTVAAVSRCTGSVPTITATTELWWSAGDDDGNGVVDDIGNYNTVESFRSGHICRRYSFCHNGAVHSPAYADSESACLQLAIMRPPGYGPGILVPTPYDTGWEFGFRFFDGDPVQSEPFLIFGNTIYGQLYDALLLSAPYELEEIETIRETKVVEDEDGKLWDRYTRWVNHTRNYTNWDGPTILDSPYDDGRLYALMLFQGKPKYSLPNPLGNYAY